jgi:hypothetical protein
VQEVTAALTTCRAVQVNNGTTSTLTLLFLRVSGMALPRSG